MDNSDNLRWRPNNAKKPPKDKTMKLWLRFRCGHVSKEPREAGQYDWSDRDLPFDIVEYAKPLKERE